jgi:hypothetical protein
MTRRELLANFAAAAAFYFGAGGLQTMEQRISLVTLGVSELAASRRFYVDDLGWKPAYEDEAIPPPP